MMRPNVLSVAVVVAVMSVLVAGCGDGGEGGKSQSRLVAGGINDPAHAAVPAQTACPVCDSPIKRDAYVDTEQGRVYFDAQDCAGKWQDTPEQYMQKLQEQAQPSPFGGGK